ncbi:hypothetical protein GCM10009095_07880 [Sphingomonas molluscorum]|nr:hypothetical protein GCM10017606_18330 [Microbacterium terregens]
MRSDCASFLTARGRPACWKRPKLTYIHIDPGLSDELAARCDLALVRAHFGIAKGHICEASRGASGARDTGRTASIQAATGGQRGFGALRAEAGEGLEELGAF